MCACWVRPQPTAGGLGCLPALAQLLDSNTVLTELDVSDNWNGAGGGTSSAEFTKELAVGLSANGALATITFGVEFDYGRKDGKVTLSTSMTEADFSSKNLGPSGAVQIVAAFLPKCL